MLGRASNTSKAVNEIRALTKYRPVNSPCFSHTLCKPGEAFKAPEAEEVSVMVDVSGCGLVLSVVIKYAGSLELCPRQRFLIRKQSSPSLRMQHSLLIPSIQSIDSVDDNAAENNVAADTAENNYAERLYCLYGP
jgi:hypothetical protein